MKKLWVLRAENGELLTSPNVMKGEIFKRLIGVKTRRVYSYALISEENISKNQLIDEMIAPFNNSTLEKQTTNKERVTFIIDSINNHEIKNAVRARCVEGNPANTILLPMLQYNKFSFKLKKRKIKKAKPVKQKIKKLKVTTNKTIKLKTKIPKVNVNKLLVEKAKQSLQKTTSKSSQIIKKIIL